MAVCPKKAPGVSPETEEYPEHTTVIQTGKTEKEYKTFYSDLLSVTSERWSL